MPGLREQDEEQDGRQVIAVAAVPRHRRRWRIAILMAAGVLVSYIDRVNLSVAHDALTSGFHMSRHTFGFLLSAYNVTYFLCQMPMGVVLDRFGVKRVGRVATLVWSAATFAIAIANSTAALFGARFLLGIGESPTFPSNTKAIGHWFPENERSMPTAMFDSAAKFASAIGVPLVGTLLLFIGWRLSFAFTGVLSLLFFWAFVAIYREPEEDAELSAAELAYIRKNPSVGIAETPALRFAELLRKKKVIGLSLGVLAYNYCFYMLLTWLPTYLSSALHLDLQRSFLYTGVPWLIATAVDLAVGGWLVDRLVRGGRNPGRLRLTFLIVGMALGLGIFGAASAHTAGVALIWITISLAGLSAHAPVVWTAPALIAHRNNVATVAGIVNCCGQIGAIAAPIVTGYLTFGQAFVVAGALQIMGILAYGFLLQSVEPMPFQRAG